jgi:hypothetical protein
MHRKSKQRAKIKAMTKIKRKRPKARAGEAKTRPDKTRLKAKITKTNISAMLNKKNDLTIINRPPVGFSTASEAYR